jgi:hypothetical protein
MLKESWERSWQSVVTSNGKDLVIAIVACRIDPGTYKYLLDHFTELTASYQRSFSRVTTNITKGEWNALKDLNQPCPQRKRTLETENKRQPSWDRNLSSGKNLRNKELQIWE